MATGTHIDCLRAITPHAVKHQTTYLPRIMGNMHPLPATPYEKLGGAAALQQLTRRFYELMDELPEAWSIRQIHPENLAGSQQSLFECLSGWLGGPTLMTPQCTHPHMPTRATPCAAYPDARDEWLLCMRLALAEQVQDEGFRQALVLAFEQMAKHLINDPRKPHPADETSAVT